MNNEIHPCPNPECNDGTLELVETFGIYRFLCHGCGYGSPAARLPQEVIRLHNLIAPSAEEIL